MGQTIQPKPSPHHLLGVLRGFGTLLVVGLCAMLYPVAAEPPPGAEPTGAATLQKAKSNESAPKSPTALALAPDGKSLYVAEQTGSSLSVIDPKTFTLLRRIPLGAQPTGIACYQSRILVTTRHQLGELMEIDSASGKILRRVRTGQGARAPVVDANKHRAYVCNYFSNSVSVIDLKSFKELTRVPVLRLPTSAALTPDGSRLFVANLIPDGPSHVEHTAAKVSVIDTQKTQIIQHIELANGSNALRQIKLTPDGSFALVTHTLARFSVPTTQLDRGWINTSALSLIDTRSLTRQATVLLDDISRGAPGSWGLSLSPDQQQLYIAHSGTHELSIINAPELWKKIKQCPDKSDLEYDLSMMTGIRQRIPLPGNGPRALLHTLDGVVTAQYFSDSLTRIQSHNGKHSVKELRLTPQLKISQQRQGEILFNDASHCFQQWQSCNACHPDEARVDGLNWDLLNDGIGNPKNAKSLLFSHFTPPTSITGCRANAEVSVRAGVRHIQFVELSETQYQAIDAYLKSLKPEPSPHLVDGKLSEAARRGEHIFKSPTRGACIICHNGPYYTDLKKHEMNNAGPADQTSTWDTPTLKEVWRTAPYMHDGRFKSVKEIITIENHGGARDRLSPQQIDDLVEYVLSL